MEALEALAHTFPGATAEVDAASLLGSTDAALRLVDAALTGWDIMLQGVAREPDGHWICTLRRMRSSDDDEVLGVGRAPALPHAICGALLHVAAQHARD